MEIRAILFGATGMVGNGVLIECLEHPDVKSVLSVSRKGSGLKHEKLEEVLHGDFLDYSAIEGKLKGYNACFFCLGVSSVGISREDYRRITYDYTERAAQVLSRLNPEMVFCYVSGTGTDDTMQSRQNWARVKGETENLLKTLPFKQVYLMRPGYIQPRKDAKHVLFLYKIVGPLYPLWKLLFPKYVMTTEEVGQSMINAVLYGAEKQTLESTDMVRLARRNQE
ncbi:MAG: NAD-dependent epimerase/dehydratase family protein [Bacteroidota bacterium]